MSSYLQLVEDARLDLMKHGQEWRAINPEFVVRMRLQKGDMQFVYNHSQLHDRTDFIDWPEPERRRHLMWLWLSSTGDRELPECFNQRYGSIQIGDRGGIVTEHTVLTAPID